MGNYTIQKAKNDERKKTVPKEEQTKIYGLQLHLPMSGEIIQSFFSLMFALL